MNAVLILLYLVLCVGIVIFVPPLVAPFALEYGEVAIRDTSSAVLMCTLLAFIAGSYAYKQGADGLFF